MTHEEKTALAGEYVLGTLNATERANVERALSTDAELASEVRFWQHRLAGLNAAAKPVEPPPGIWAGIERGLGNQPQQSVPSRAVPLGGEIIELKRKVGIWRTATIATTALAAALAAVVVLGPGLGLNPPPERYVAVLDQADGPPAIVVDVDAATRTVTAYSVAAAAAPERSYELWYIGEGAPPVSMGVLDEVGARIVMAAADLPAFNPVGATFAVTDEPRGGSPTGVATGEIVFIGEMIRTIE
jgi:anti-sigma-K factor RskA